LPHAALDERCGGIGYQQNRKQKRDSTLIEGEEKKRGNSITNSDRRMSRNEGGKVCLLKN